MAPTTLDTRLSLADALADAYKMPEPEVAAPTGDAQVSVAGPAHVSFLRVRLPGGGTITIGKTPKTLAAEFHAAVHEAARRCGVALKIGT